MKVCFLLTHIPNPRINKRIDMFRENDNVYVICTRRKSQNVWEPVQKVEHIIFDIDLPSAEHIVNRYIVSQNFQRKVMDKLVELKPDLIYAESLDSLIIASKYKEKHNVNIIFEVADLRENYIIKPRGLVKKIITHELLRVEKNKFKDVDILVVTSPKFYEMHYKNLISMERVLFVPNIPDVAVFKTYKKKQEGDFTVGFIGGIRYLKQMKMLVDAAKIAGCKVIFAGAGGTIKDYENIQSYCEGKDWVKFIGRYDYNSQIAKLYGMIDCVYSVYDADNPNVRIALPNKLYESIYCELPIIVAKETYLEELVKEWKVGISVSHKDLKELVEALKQLKNRKNIYNECVEGCKRNRSIFKTEEINKSLINTLMH